jgi:hypothetical protein
VTVALPLFAPYFSKVPLHDAVSCCGSRPALKAPGQASLTPQIVRPLSFFRQFGIVLRVDGGQAAQIFQTMVRYDDPLALHILIVMTCPNPMTHVRSCLEGVPSNLRSIRYSCVMILLTCACNHTHTHTRTLLTHTYTYILPHTHTYTLEYAHTAHPSHPLFCCRL